MTTWTDDEAAGVIGVILRRWPGGVGNRGWEPVELQGYVAEMQVDRLTPAMAVMGLRASGSGFIPSVGQVRELAREAKGPMTAAEIYEAEQRLIAERAPEAERRIAAAYAAIPRSVDGP